LFFFDSAPPSSLLIGTLLASANCSTVSLVRFPGGFATSSEPFELGGIAPAFIGAKDLGRMAGRKRTIAGLPQATALERSWLRILRSLLVLIRIEFRQSGG
jgi:hypothetical protein